MTRLVVRFESCWIPTNSGCSFGANMKLRSSGVWPPSVAPLNDDLALSPKRCPTSWISVLASVIGSFPKFHRLRRVR